MRELLDKDDAVLHSDILDPIERDTPSGCWSLQFNGNATGVVVRSLLWPGYYSYNALNCKQFGSVYVGDGIKNSDLPFML
jgi:radial spoke head protein 9